LPLSVLAGEAGIDRQDHREVAEGDEIMDYWQSDNGLVKLHRKIKITVEEVE
jgi:hypothetical protein